MKYLLIVLLTSFYSCSYQSQDSKNRNNNKITKTDSIISSDMKTILEQISITSLELKDVPFTKEQLLPQEETLEITKQKGELYIGLPKETHFQEKRICLTPDAIAAIVANDHRVLIEKGAGEKAGFSDSDYSEAGAELTDDKNKVFGCPIILKVEPPSW